MISIQKPSREEQKLIALEKARVNLILHKLVVKIISWRAGLLEGADIISSNKITQREWGDYRAHILRISKTESLERVKEKLVETRNLIKSRNGFK